MQDLTRLQIKQLIETRASICVSIYMPAYKAGQETRQNPIRFKNLLGQVRTKLNANGHTEAAIQAVLAPAEKRISDRAFWRTQAEGLAVFLTEADSHFFRLPTSFEPLAVVSNRFHVKPLLPILNQKGHFFILALSQGHVRLLCGSATGISETALDGFPKGIEDALSYDDPEKQLQHQTLARTGGGQPAVFHGHGDDYQTQETIRRYFNLIDQRLQDVLGDEQAPLVVACVDYLFPIFEAANAYPHLIAEHIPGNPDEKKPEELHRQAWEILKPRFEQGREEALARYRALAQKPLGASSLNEIIPAAYFKRVDTLFIPRGKQQWGRFEPETGTVQIETEATSGNEDLYDFAAAHTILNGGTVYVLDPESIPGETRAAAILRY